MICAKCSHAGDLLTATARMIREDRVDIPTAIKVIRDEHAKCVDCTCGHRLDTRLKATELAGHDRFGVAK